MKSTLCGVLPACLATVTVSCSHLKVLQQCVINFQKQRMHTFSHNGIEGSALLHYHFYPRVFDVVCSFVKDLDGGTRGLDLVESLLASAKTS